MVYFQMDMSQISIAGACFYCHNHGQQFVLLRLPNICQISCVLLNHFPHAGMIDCSKINKINYIILAFQNKIKIYFFKWVRKHFSSILNSLNIDSPYEKNNNHKTKCCRTVSGNIRKKIKTNLNVYPFLITT